VFTATAVAGLYVTDTSKGAGSIVTAQYGVFVGPLTAGATNIAYYSNVVAGLANWSLYQAGTAQSYLAGSLGVGDSTNALPAKLSVRDATGHVGTFVQQLPAVATLV
jgi:hypothetical protein